jgi:TonB-linked SusC/RagA family outer membrane protein
MCKQKGFLLLLWVIMLSVLPLGSFAQEKLNKKVSVNVKQASVESVLSSVKKQTGLSFVYNAEQAKSWPKIDLKETNRPAGEVLDKIVGLIGCSYEMKNDIVTIYKQQLSGSERTVRGYVRDENGEVLIGALVSIGEGQLATVTDAEGFYTLNIPTEKTILKYSYVGMETKYVTFKVGTDLVRQDIVMANNTQLEEVVVTGMFERRKESFTGASTTFTQDEIKQVGNQNLLKSLKILDPSFQIIESTINGSNPNATPEIQVRGATSFNLQSDYQGNPNQPLFILDGFETDITKIYDMDMNRIQSVTILKDAAAKAIYGSKAGNGVVVVETVRPKSGQLRVYYNGNLDIEAPDLTGYNLMNAREKLDFEIERGMYSRFAMYPEDLQTLQTILKQNQDNIIRGVDTYWLAKPLRTGIGQKHYAAIEGGDNRMRYMLGVSFNNVKGAMKGSDRNTANISGTLSYSYKNLIFRNTMEYTNNWANESPYGEFSTYAELNPYWSPYDENGNLVKLLGMTPNRLNAYNPLYNASLNTKNSSSYAEFRDNFGMEWNISSAIRFTARATFMQNDSEGDLFYPASHTRFINYDEAGMSDRKGLYTKSHGKTRIFSTDAGLNINKTIGKHLFFVNTTWNMNIVKQKSDSYSVEGFGNDYMDNVGFGTQYLTNSHPSASDNETHEIGLIGALNYSYDDRYLLDASIRESGSSIYGSDKRWGTFWSAGIGWNIHKEPFLRDNNVIRQWKLRASTGFTGTQNFNPYQARARYRYSDVIYNGQFGAILLGLPNNNLQWQKVRDTNFGTDLALGRMLNVRFDYYIQMTSNMLSDIDTAPSLGFTTYRENLGEIENKGYDLSVSFTPWRNDAKRGYVTLTASALHNKNKIKKIYDIFTSLNDRQNEDKDGYLSVITNESVAADKIKKITPSTLYYEGCSMTAIWGVPSLGIDPQSGRRIYVDRDGNPTYNWNSKDQVVIGDTAPKVQGALGLNGGWNGFTFSVACSYRLGGDLYNMTLVEKIENITGDKNLDRRIYDSWRKPGDIAPYRELEVGTQNSTNFTKPNSCFVQRNNELYISNVMVGYEFNPNSFIKHAGLKYLKLQFYMNDLARISSIKTERGTNYPFARNFSIALNASF